MRLIIPTPEELRQALATGAGVWRAPGRDCDDDAAPPPIVLERALESVAAHPAAGRTLRPCAARQSV